MGKLARLNSAMNRDCSDTPFFSIPTRSPSLLSRLTRN